MQNSLSHIYQTLQEVFQSQPTDAAKWSEGVEIVQTNDAQTGATFWWVADVTLSNALEQDEIATLKKGGYLDNDGQAVTKTFSKTRRRAYCLLLDKLRKGVRAEEGKVAKSVGDAKYVKQLEAELKAAREYNAAEEAMARVLDAVATRLRVRPPRQVKQNELVFAPRSTPLGEAVPIVPTLLLSDWHWGEVVSQQEVVGMNQYDLTVAKQRAMRIAESALEILFCQAHGTTYQGIVVALAGDMVSGLIHEELRATNAAHMAAVVTELAEVLADIICRYACEFEVVYVPCVGGNHGRMGKVPQAKRAMLDNWDTVLYTVLQKFVQMRLGTECNVQFSIAPSFDLTYRIYNTTYLLTHGDGLKGGRDHGEFWANVLKSAQYKHRPNESQFGRGFDYLLCGHFHRYGAVGNVIVNGSLKGFDELGMRESYREEHPVQALWLTEADRGVTSHFKVFAEFERVHDNSLHADAITPARSFEALAA